MNGPARVNGNLIFGNGNDFNDTSTQIHRGHRDGFVGGGGVKNVLTLNASATSSDALPGDVNDFQTLTGAGSNLDADGGGGQINGGATPLAVTVIGGTLVLTGNNNNFNGTVLINTGGTLQARAQSLPNPSGGQGVITDNGVLLVDQVSPNATRVQ